jgi:hypothetical protein
VTVADLLAASRAAHAEYRRIANRRRITDNDRQLHDALAFRQKAHDADPEHRHPAWQADIAPHADLMAFYRQKLGIS